MKEVPFTEAEEQSCRQYVDLISHSQIYCRSLRQGCNGKLTDTKWQAPFFNSVPIPSVIFWAEAPSLHGWLGRCVKQYFQWFQDNFSIFCVLCTIFKMAAVHLV